MQTLSPEECENLFQEMLKLILTENASIDEVRLNLADAMAANLINAGLAQNLQSALNALYEKYQIREKVFQAALANCQVPSVHRPVFQTAVVFLQTIFAGLEWGTGASKRAVEYCGYRF